MTILNIKSFNCKNFKGTLREDFIKDIFQQCDFMCIQEHWLYEHEFYRFDALHIGDYTVMYHGTSAMDPSILRSGRPHGGTVILWKSSLCHKVTPIKTISDRLTCVKVDVDVKSTLLLFSVYMPCDNGYRGADFQMFQDVLAEISGICQANDSQNIILAGDFNADVARQTPQSEELLQFCANESLELCVNCTISSVDYTYESDINGSRSLIDHVIVSQRMKDCISHYDIIDNVNNFSDHRCVNAKFRFDVEYFSNADKNSIPRIAWYKASIGDINCYKEQINRALAHIDIPNDALSCVDTNCERHSKDIDKYCSDLVTICIDAAKLVVPTIGDRSKRHKAESLAGWNEHISHLKDVSLTYHWLWKESGKPRNGYYADMRRRTRAQYHYAVKQIKSNQNRLKSEKMALAISNNDTRNLWTEVRKMKGNTRKMPTVVDGVTGNEQIAEKFAGKFKSLYNSVGYNQEEMAKIREVIDERVKGNTFFSKALFGIEEFKEAMKYIHRNKYDGTIGLFSDHILNASEELWLHIVKLMNCMLIHGITPNDMLCGTLIPIPKNRRVPNSTSDNFRAICLQNVLCKIFDIMILHRETKALQTSERQFGFKKGLSATLAAASVLETVDYYTQKNGSVYLLALDATKAFDRVQYYRLFKALLDRRVDILYIRILFNMYCRQKLRVLFNGTSSEWFSVTNGVKQGGVLSPTLFGVYVDGMLKKLEVSGYGCYVGLMYCGCFGYADDLLLCAPSLHSLRKMITICERYAMEFNIIFNGQKSKTMCFGYYACQQPMVYVNGDVVPVVTKMDYLGHTIVNNNNDPLLEDIVKDFNCKVNHFLADFNQVSSTVKNVLFKQYCTSFYGIPISLLEDQQINRLHVSWRNAVRRIWQIPRRSHNRFLPHISSSLPLEIMLHTRFMKFFINGFNSKNELVSFLCKHSIKCMSRMGRNLRYVCQLYNVNCDNVGYTKCSTIKHDIIKVWKENSDIEDFRISKQIVELCDIRDGIGEWLLERHEICDIIQLSCCVYLDNLRCEL